LIFTDDIAPTRNNWGWHLFACETFHGQSDEEPYSKPDG
jgi:hypothetical protein